ncbi:hypothetical protein LQG66_31410 [Bradyrhizobium ontarionense]|uniref:Uncharacterized protein n=1 Tax=Bradyrhizobium ontarionense TaxID=2898149 RepID=A0ABY3R912_9BRAD|nr:hypothetical protein [Bradyrhizobium sp. A19]UFZ03673.1 hypothetical protein LQG66_31410 [Bradyrhizobium sp. A19]
MTSWKTLTAALLLSATAAAPASAQGSSQGWFWGQQEPAAFQAMYPNRDVLNGGELTPAGRMGLMRAYGAAPVSPPSVQRSPYDRVPQRR